MKLKTRVAVVGGGHAGVEAALASARLGIETTLFSLSDFPQNTAAHAHRGIFYALISGNLFLALLNNIRNKVLTLIPCKQTVQTIVHFI